MAPPVFALKLIHPSSSPHLINLLALPHDQLDLADIGHRFDLQLNTIRLNGHFISYQRNGMSYLTWTQVLEFFEKRGYSSGRRDDDAIRVDGRRIPSASTQGASLSIPEEMRFCRSKKRVGRDFCEPTSQHNKKLRQNEHIGVDSARFEGKRIHLVKKRAGQEDSLASFTQPKRVRQDGNSDIGSGLSGENLHESQQRRDPHKHLNEDDLLACTTLWKRVKEIKV